jgi:hypothetical protein
VLILVFHGGDDQFRFDLIYFMQSVVINVTRYGQAEYFLGIAFMVTISWLMI